MTYTKQDFLRILRRNGYYKVRQNGGHAIYENGKGDTITINNHPNKMVCKRLIKEHNLIV